jgi:hypothetical protein
MIPENGKCGNHLRCESFRKLEIFGILINQFEYVFLSPDYRRGSTSSKGCPYSPIAEDDGDSLSFDRHPWATIDHDILLNFLARNKGDCQT